MPIKTLRFPKKQFTVHEVYGKVTPDQFERSVINYQKEGITKLTLLDASAAIGV